MTPTRHYPDMNGACLRDNHDYLCTAVAIDRE